MTDKIIQLRKNHRSMYLIVEEMHVALCNDNHISLVNMETKTVTI